MLDFAQVRSVSVVMENLPLDELRTLWRQTFGWAPLPSSKQAFLAKNLHYQQQVKTHGGLKKATLRQLQDIAAKCAENPTYSPTPFNTLYKPGTRLIRSYKGKAHEVTLTETGYLYNGTTYTSLSAIARHITGTAWNGHTFFGLKTSKN